MKKFILSICCVAAMCTASAQESHIFPDSLYLFSYFTNKDANRHGMHYAWSRDGYEWNTVGNPVGFLQPDTASDAPRLRDPFLLQDKKAAVRRYSPQPAASLNSSQISLFSVCLLPQIISNACKTKQRHNQKNTRDQNDPPCLCHQRFFRK